MTKTKTFLIQSGASFIVLMLLLTPVFSFAQEDAKGWKGLIPCSNTSNTAEVEKGAATPKGECDFDAFLELINKVIKFLIFTMAIPIAAVMFCYAGFLLVTAGEETASARTKAKEIFTNTVFGLAIAVAGWLIIRTILSILGYKGDWIGL
jgi:Type IV secretion system pilin